MRATMDVQVRPDLRVTIKARYEMETTPEIVTLTFPDAAKLRIILTAKDLDELKERMSQTRAEGA